jgi:hypothetical protein
VVRGVSAGLLSRGGAGGGSISIVASGGVVRGAEAAGSDVSVWADAGAGGQQAAAPRRRRGRAKRKGDMVMTWP